MRIMKILQNAIIQHYVDGLKGSTLNPLAALYVAAGGEIGEASGVFAHAKGVEAGVFLMQKYKQTLRNYRRKYPIRVSFPRFGIYMATQQTSDGLDRLYFVGTPADICKKLEAVQQSKRTHPD